MPARRLQDGSSLVVLFVAMLPLVVAAGTLLTVLANYSREVEQRSGREVARTISVSGAHDALARLHVEPDFTGTYPVAVNGGTALVTITSWETDGEDNDGNGLRDAADPDEEDFFTIASEGWLNADLDADGQPIDPTLNTYHSTADILIRRVDFDLGFRQALYIDDPLARINIRGVAFEISGRDTNLDGTRGWEPERFAVGVPGDARDFIDQITRHQVPKIVGLGGTPSVGDVGTEQDMATLLEEIAPLATERWTEMDAHLRGRIGDDEADWLNPDPVVAHAPGNLTISGHSVGSGVLIVEGDLEIRGNFKFAGIILVGGSFTFRGGGQAGMGQDVYGAVMALGSVNGVDLELRGRTGITYSQEGIELARQALSNRFEVLYWLQR